MIRRAALAAVHLAEELWAGPHRLGVGPGTGGCAQHRGLSSQETACMVHISVDRLRMTLATLSVERFMSSALAAVAMLAHIRGT